MNPVPLDSSDPIVAALALLLTELLKRLVNAATLARLTPILPAIVVIFAMALRVGHDAILEDGGLTWASAARGLAAAGVAVLTHSQMRSVAKAISEPPKGTVDDAGPGVAEPPRDVSAKP